MDVRILFENLNKRGISSGERRKWGILTWVLLSSSCIFSAISSCGSVSVNRLYLCRDDLTRLRRWYSSGVRPSLISESIAIGASEKTRLKSIATIRKIYDWGMSGRYKVQKTWATRVRTLLFNVLQNKINKIINDVAITWSWGCLFIQTMLAKRAYKSEFLSDIIQRKKRMVCVEIHRALKAHTKDKWIIIKTSSLILLHGTPQKNSIFKNLTRKWNKAKNLCILWFKMSPINCPVHP